MRSTFTAGWRRSIRPLTIEERSAHALGEAEAIPG
jgi:hypothetical protein